MPKIDWIGKSGVVNHHREVAYRLVHCDKGFSAGDAAAGNLLVQGDNLEALRALLPYYAGRVKCIYIDPPYNTGNEGWVYNDRVNSPEIREWLGKVVGGDGQIYKTSKVRIQNENGEWEDRKTGEFIFENEWQSFRTRQNRALELTSATREIPAESVKIAIKVVDLFGNDTMKVLEV